MLACICRRWKCTLFFLSFDVYICHFMVSHSFSLTHFFHSLPSSVPLCARRRFFGEQKCNTFVGTFLLRAQFSFTQIEILDINNNNKSRERERKKSSQVYGIVQCLSYWMCSQSFWISIGWSVACQKSRPCVRSSIRSIWNGVKPNAWKRTRARSDAMVAYTSFFIQTASVPGNYGYWIPSWNERKTKGESEESWMCLCVCVHDKEARHEQTSAEKSESINKSEIYKLVNQTPTAPSTYLLSKFSHLDVSNDGIGNRTVSPIHSSVQHTDDMTTTMTMRASSRAKKTVEMW